MLGSKYAESKTYYNFTSRLLCFCFCFCLLALLVRRGEIGRRGAVDEARRSF